MKTKARHKIVYKFVRPIMKRILKKKYNFTYEACDLKPPFLVFANHTTDFDPFFIAFSFKCPIYFVMSDHVSSLKAGKLIKYLVSPIPITKSSTDAETVRNVFSCVKQGGAVGIFPEGNKSFAGEMSWIKPSTVKLVKKLNIPVVVYSIEGGYFSMPRWSKNKRKGHIHGFPKIILTPEEIQKMNNDELYELIVNALRVNAYEKQEENKVRFVGEDKASNIEALLYTCPNCGSISSIYGEGDDVLCKNCDLHAVYNDFGYLENVKNCKFERLDKWDAWQKENLKNLDISSLPDDHIFFEDKSWEVQKKISKYKSEVLGTFTSVLTKAKLYLKNEDEKSAENKIVEINLFDIAGTAIEGTCGVQIWTKNGDVYRLKNGLHVSGLKYVNYIHHIIGKEYKF